MTKEQLQQCAAAMIAHAGGTSVEYKYPNSTEWTRTQTPSWDILGGILYRVKPKPKTRQWSKPEDVPFPHCFIRRVGHSGWAILLAAGLDGIQAAGVCGGIVTFGYDQLSGLEHSTDRLTWKPCEVSE